MGVPEFHEALINGTTHEIAMALTGRARRCGWRSSLINNRATLSRAAFADGHFSV